MSACRAEGEGIISCSDSRRPMFLLAMLTSRFLRFTRSKRCQAQPWWALHCQQVPFAPAGPRARPHGAWTYQRTCSQWVAECHQHGVFSTAAIFVKLQPMLFANYSLPGASVGFAPCYETHARAPTQIIEEMLVVRPIQASLVLFIMVPRLMSLTPVLLHVRYKLRLHKNSARQTVSKIISLKPYMVVFIAFSMLFSSDSP